MFSAGCGMSKVKELDLRSDEDEDEDEETLAPFPSPVVSGGSALHNGLKRYEIDAFIS